MSPRPLQERLLSKLELSNNGCLIWRGKCTRDGYGTIKNDGRYLRAHRVAYELLVGPIPAGLQLDHLCRVRNCCNPLHLEPVTSRVNTLRGNGLTAIHALKTSCPQGHAYDENNTYLDRANRRHCRTCRANHRSARALRLKAGAL
jgi:hypothetical protein